MSDRQQARAVDAKGKSPTKQHLPSKNVPSHYTHPAVIIQDARTSAGSLTPVDVLQLQRTIGNQAVGQLLAEIGRLPSTTLQPPVQRQGPEEEELLQGKMTEAVQRQPETEEEELLQGKFTDECIQCQELPEEEELLQGKMMDTVQRQEPEEEEPIQGKFAPGLTGTLQAKDDAPANMTGMPDNLKAGIEKLSGTAMDDVKVHYNSTKPAFVQALAYTQGTDIHLGPGQERHLPHEAWHVVQQSQGRVRPITQYRGVAINDDAGLEREADVMGSKAVHDGGILASNIQKKEKNTTIGIHSAPFQGKFWGGVRDMNNEQIRTLCAELYNKTPEDEQLDELRDDQSNLYLSIEAIGLRLNLGAKHKFSERRDSKHIKSTIITAASGQGGGGETVYRMDGRTPTALKKALGFFSFNPITLSHAKEMVRMWFAKNEGASPATYIQNWIANPAQAGNYLVSTDFRTDCGGQGGGLTKYKMSLPTSLQPVTVDLGTLGCEPEEGLRAKKMPTLYLDASTLADANLIAVKPENGNELTFITGIPYEYIIEYQENGSTDWLAMP